MFGLLDMSKTYELLVPKENVPWLVLLIDLTDAGYIVQSMFYLCIQVSLLLVNIIDFRLLYRVEVSFSWKPFRELCQANDMVALRVITAKAFFVLSGCFTSPKKFHDSLTN